MTVSTRPRLIVALDVAKLTEARALIAALDGLDVIFKVGYEPLYNYGDEIRQQLESSGADYFIDGKLHDIPRTVAAAVSSALGRSREFQNLLFRDDRTLAGSR